MTFYMIRAKGTRLWYRHGTPLENNWLDREDATVWLEAPTGILENLQRQCGPLASCFVPELVRFHASDFPDLVMAEAVDMDWQGLYINEELVLEGSRFRLDDVLKALGLNVKFVGIRLLSRDKRALLPADLAAASALEEEDDEEWSDEEWEEANNEDDEDFDDEDFEDDFEDDLHGEPGDDESEDEDEEG